MSSPIEKLTTSLNLNVINTGIYRNNNYFRINLDETNKSLMRKFNKALKENNFQAVKCDESLKGQIERDYLIINNTGTDKIILKNNDL
jgi:hypothetical protein